MIHVYLRGRGDAYNNGHAHRADARAVEAFLTAFPGTPRVHQETDLRAPSRLVERHVGKAMVDMLGDGDMLVFGELAAFDYPSDALRVVQHCIGHGVLPYILDLDARQPAITCFGQLQAMAAAFGSLEAKLVEVATERDKIQAQADDRFQQATAQMAAQMVQNFGAPPALLYGVQPLGDVRQHVTNGAGSTGHVIRMEREALGWSQAQLAEHLGISQPSVSRIEANTAPADQMAAAFERMFGQGAEQQGEEA